MNICNDMSIIIKIFSHPGKEHSRLIQFKHVAVREHSLNSERIVINQGLAFIHLTINRIPINVFTTNIRNI